MPATVASRPYSGRAAPARPRAHSGVRIRFPAFDPRNTGSIYGFADLDSAASKSTPAGVWNGREIKVVGQTYTVTRNGEVINSRVGLKPP